MDQESKKDQVWEKGEKIPGKDPNVFRKDGYGNVIHKDSYGTLDQYGWEMDHKKPKAKGGGDGISNLQPLHWEKNRELGDKKK